MTAGFSAFVKASQADLELHALAIEKQMSVQNVEHADVQLLATRRSCQLSDLIVKVDACKKTKVSTKGKWLYFFELTAHENSVQVNAVEQRNFLIALGSQKQERTTQTTVLALLFVADLEHALIHANIFIFLRIVGADLKKAFDVDELRVLLGVFEGFLIVDVS